MTKQTNQFETVRGNLHDNWSKAAVDILREELENLDKDQTKTFFDSVAALMSNQVRELTTKSVSNYVQFFRKFKKDRYPTPKDIIAREYDADSPFEVTFITLKLEKKEKICFADDLNSVCEELVSVVGKMIEKINHIPRADTQIANTDKSHLWDIQEDDQIVLVAKKEITDILQENLAATEQCVHVYDDFVFLLSEDQRLEAFLNKKPFSRDEFRAEI
jgi:hypothetical protein